MKTRFCLNPCFSGTCQRVEVDDFEYAEAVQS